LTLVNGPGHDVARNHRQSYLLGRSSIAGGWLGCRRGADGCVYPFAGRRLVHVRAPVDREVLRCGGLCRKGAEGDIHSKAMGSTRRQRAFAASGAGRRFRGRGPSSVPHALCGGRCRYREQL